MVLVVVLCLTMFNWRCINVCLLNGVYALRPLIKFAVNLIIVFGMCV